MRLSLGLALRQALRVVSLRAAAPSTVPPSAIPVLVVRRGLGAVKAIPHPVPPVLAAHNLPEVDEHGTQSHLC